MGSRWIVPPAAGMIEPALAPEIYSDQIGAIEYMIGDMARIYYCAEQMSLCGDALIAQSVVVLKVVRPLIAIARGFPLMSQCLVAAGNIVPPEQPSPFRPYVVR